jgi:hypothetical protein
LFYLNNPFQNFPFGNYNKLSNWTDTEAISYLIVGGDDGYIPYVSVNSGSTIITEYGNIDDYVKGSFSGSVYESETNDPVDIDGTFLIKELLINKKIRGFLCRNYA